MLTDGEIAYDYLIVAAGATHAYFGHDEWRPAAPGLKSLEDARRNPSPGAARFRTGRTRDRTPRVGRRS